MLLFLCIFKVTCYNLYVVIDMKKKTKRNLYKTNTSSDMEYSKIIKITLGVVLVLTLTYFVTALATGEIKFGKEKEELKEEVIIQYEEIIAGQILNRDKEEYYVLLFDFTDTYASYYLSLKDTYIKNDKALPFYIVDLEKHVNKSIVAADENEYKANVNNIDNLKVINPTILKVKNHKVIKNITGKENILKFFEENN